MKNLMKCSIHNMATQALMIGFLLCIFPIMSAAQEIEIKDITKVYYGDPNVWGGNKDKAKGRIKNDFGSDPAGYRWRLSEGWGSASVVVHYIEISRDDKAIYLRNIYTNENLKIDVYNKSVVLLANGKVTSELGKLLLIENENRELTPSESAEIIRQEHAANRDYELKQPLSDEDLAAVMEWIGKEASRHSVDFCYKRSYARRTYTDKKTCEEQENGECVQLGLLWYVKCEDGYETSIPPHCLMQCPGYEEVLAGAQMVKVDCGLLCALDNDVCVGGVAEMVFAPILMVMNIVSFGLSGAAAKAAKNAAVAGAQAGVTKQALSSNWPKLYKAIETSEEIITPVIDAKDQFEYVLNNVENLSTELERWKISFEKDFELYTSILTNKAINDYFQSRDDRSYIKRAYGQYLLTAMLEADGWRIAKSVLSAASIEPTGVVAVINAFAHPVCDPVRTPFPKVRLIPTNERYQLYREVKFHQQNNMTLEEAKNLAKLNSWTLANEDEVKRYWSLGLLDVYAFGMLSNGKFAVPVQSDYSNFKKGHNIGATGGNQGFFYTEGLYDASSTTIQMSSLALTHANFQIEDNLHHRVVVAGDQSGDGIFHQYSQNRKNAKWVFQSTGDGYYNIIDCKHNLALIAGDVANNRVYHQKPNGRDNAKWKLEPVGDGSFYITDKKHGKSLIAGTSYDGNIYHQNPKGRRNATWKLTIAGNGNGIKPGEYTPPPSYARIQITDNLHHKALIADTNGIYHRDATNRTHSKWEFIPTGDGYYYIVDSNDNLAIVAGDTANNHVYHQDTNERDNAKWKLEPVGDGTFYITDKKHGKSLIAGTTYDGNIYHQKPKGRKNATWKLTVVDVKNGMVPTELK